MNIDIVIRLTPRFRYFY